MPMNELIVTTPSDREIVMTREFNAARHLVFDSHTKPELLKRWLLGPPGWTMPVCEIDLRPGGRYRYVWRNSDGTEMGMGGTFREIVHPEKIVCTQLFDEDWTGGEALSTLVFTELNDDKTKLTNTMLYSSRETRDACLKSGMDKGMAASYDSLDVLLASNVFSKANSFQIGDN
jgi:uncharacterized protein YndB with AHSA1/START domain